MTPVDLAQQILTRDRHILGVAGAEEIVALVGAGAALDAGIEEHAERAVLAAKFAHLFDGLILPVLYQFARKTERLLEFGRRDIGLAGGHAAGSKSRNFQRVAKFAFASVRFFHLFHGALRSLAVYDRPASSSRAQCAR